MVVLHYTAMANAADAADWLCNPDSGVSCHWLIAEDGEVMSLVPEALRAWHAGAGEWGGNRDVNSVSIGIELDNPGDRPFAPAQIAALLDLMKGIAARWNIRPERVVGHSDTAPGRKIDPGPHFDWPALARAGFSVSPSGDAAADEVSPGRFRAHARAFGYSAPVDDETLLTAFRLRFRPGEEGPLDATDMGIVVDLARRFPVNAATVTA